MAFDQSVFAVKGLADVEVFYLFLRRVKREAALSQSRCMVVK